MSWAYLHLFKHHRKYRTYRVNLKGYPFSVDTCSTMAVQFRILVLTRVASVIKAFELTILRAFAVSLKETWKLKMVVEKPWNIKHLQKSLNLVISHGILKIFPLTFTRFYICYQHLKIKLQCRKSAFSDYVCKMLLTQNLSW